MRIAEAAALRNEDLALEERLVYIKSGKGGRARTAFLTPYAADVLRVWEKASAEVRPKRRGPKKKAEKEIPVFGLGRKALMTHVNKGLAEACTELNLPRITSHGFRHSLGTHLMQAGCEIRSVQAILGHERVSSTQIYTALDKTELKKCLDQRHPRR
jgi:site-specific recombinase XerD